MIVARNLMDELLYDVIIVGFGPVGATLANFLGRGGHRVLALERGTEIYPLPRAVHFDAEIMRVFQELDLTDALEPYLYPILGAEFVDPSGKRIIGMDTPGPVEGPLSWVTDYLFHQPSLEAVLRSRTVAMETVDLLDDREAVSIVDEGDAVRVTFKNRRDATEQTARARYLVGCDGARSFVRKTLDMGVETLGFDQEWLVVDVVMKRDTGLPNILQQICDPARPVTVVPNMGPRRRWELQLQQGETKEEMERPERIWRLLSPWISPLDAELERAVVYEFHGLVAADWRRGRALLAGDAAHQMPPFMGQGMCSGIRDAANLAWKMDLVLRGLAEDRLLDLYETEREPHARYYVDHSVAAGRLIDALAAEAAGIKVEVDDSAGYGGSREAPYLEHGILRPTGTDDTLTGRLFVQPRIVDDDGNARRLDDLVGGGFALFARSCPLAALAPQTVAFLDRIGAQVLAIPREREIGRLLAPYIDDGRIVVVRPDRYVFTVARGIEDLEAALATLRDMLALSPDRRAKEKTT